MPRIPRSSIKTIYYHVMVQGINKMYIFDKPEDIKYYIKIMFELRKYYSLEIKAYCVMNNHVHILIKVEKTENLSKFMHRLNTKYGIYYNKKYDRVGFVFRDRFKSQGIYDTSHLYHCINYIYDNPVKAGICEKPEDYPYSNYKKIQNLDDREYVFIDAEEDKPVYNKRYLFNFLEKNNIEIDELKNNKIILKELIRILKDEYKLSFRQISMELNINRETITKTYKAEK